MKWFPFLVVVCIFMEAMAPSAALTESGKQVVLQSISYDPHSAVKEKETITFKLNGPVAPQLFTLRGENPRLVIDFPESIYLGKNVIVLSGGVLASTIRIGLHQTPAQKTRVVVDLVKGMMFQYTSDYVEQDNILTVTLTSDTAQGKQDTSRDLQAQNQNGQNALPNQVIAAPGTLGKKNIPSVFAAKEVETESAARRPVTTAKPTILEISFDNSSRKGEVVRFRLNDFSPPALSVIEQDSPHFLCDFMAMHLGPDVPEIILPKGKYIERIRTIKQQNPDKVQVIVDLSPNRDYDLQQIFFKKDNLFVVIVNELSPEKEGHQVK